MLGISIIICCYNSVKRLSETLRHICQQEVDENIPWEVIVVNNNSTDSTKDIAFHLLKKYNCPAPFQIVNQPISGLSPAREKGIATAKYTYLLFCDDDNWLQKNYVQTAYNIMSQNPQIGALGGQIEAICEVSPPRWFEKFKGGYAVGQQNEDSGDISDKKGCLFGAGIVINGKALRLIYQKGYKSLLTGRNEGKLTAGDDTELCYALRMAGYRIWYDERLTFQHFIPKQRLTFDYAKKLYQGFGESLVVLDAYKYILEGHSYTSYIYLINKIIGYLKIFSIKFLFMEIFHLNTPSYFQWPYIIMTKSAIKSYLKQGKLVTQHMYEIHNLSKKLKQESIKK